MEQLLITNPSNAILTVVKDEQEYLNDFLKYHREMGLHIFVFEDLFSCSHKDICSKYDNVFLHSVKELYTDDEQEQLIEDRKNKVSHQVNYINRGLKLIHSLNKYDWCFIIDADEYITSSKDFPSILNNYTDYDAILLYWMNYGCSGHLYKPIYDRPIYDIYTERCCYELYLDMKYYAITKLCANMRKYRPEMKYGVHNAMINWVKPDFTYKRTEIVYEPLYLRHYITKSFEEYCYKIYVRGMMHEKHRTLRSFFEMQPQYKDRILEDKELQEYICKKYNIDIFNT